MPGERKQFLWVLPFPAAIPPFLFGFSLFVSKSAGGAAEEIKYWSFSWLSGRWEVLDWFCAGFSFSFLGISGEFGVVEAGAESLEWE